jgi:hypothetical protein
VRLRRALVAVAVAVIGVLALQAPVYAQGDPFTVVFLTPYEAKPNYVNMTFKLTNNTPSRVSVIPQRPGGREGRQLVLEPKGELGAIVTDNIHLPCAQQVTVDFKYGDGKQVVATVKTPACAQASAPPGNPTHAPTAGSNGSGGSGGFVGFLKKLGVGALVIVGGAAVLIFRIRRRRRG